MKGLREPLLLIGTGFFLASIWMPPAWMLGTVGIALGMHDLRKSEGAAVLGRLRIASAVLAWVACANMLLSSLLGGPLMFIDLTLLAALSCAAFVLRALARSAGATGLARAFLVLAFTPFASLPLALSGVPGLAIGALSISSLTTAVLSQRVRVPALRTEKA